jgi:hypothetical protein
LKSRKKISNRHLGLGQRKKQRIGKDTMNDLVTEVKNDISAFLEQNNELLFNERDLQMHLAIWLKRIGKYDDVDVEYYVPFEEFGGKYIWEGELRLDIVVKKGEEYIPVELKYKTKKVEKKLTRFNEELKREYIVVKDQAAQNLGKYDFWKDVRRIELVRNRFNRVKNGLAVFVTNDKSYLKPSRENSNCKALDMSKEGVHFKHKFWKNENSGCAKEHPNFEVEKEYIIEWKSCFFEGEEFNYCIVKI